MQTWEAPLHRFSRNSFPQRLSTKNYLEYWITADISPATFNDAEFTTKKKISGSICIYGRTLFSWSKGYDLICSNLFIRSNVNRHHLRQHESGQTLRYIFHLWQMPSPDLHKVTREWLTITSGDLSNSCQKIGISTKQLPCIIPRPHSE